MIISVESLTKEYKVKIPTSFLKDIFYPSYRKVTAVHSISFSIAKGESVALLGPNGAGKTTTMKMLSGLIYPTSGKISVLGFYPFDRKREYLMKIGLVMGNKTGLDWDLTPRQSFDLIKKMYQIPEKAYHERLETLTQMLQVQSFLDNQVRKLSLGERMKMELIGAILHDPEVLFLDEPTIGLDIVSKQKIREFLRTIQKQFNVTLLLTSHDMDDIEKVSDRVIVINKGEKVYDDTLQRLKTHTKKDRYVRLIYKETPTKETFAKNAEVVERSDSSLVVKVTNDELPAILEKATGSEDLIDIEISSTPLDEIIADIYRQGSSHKD